MWPSTSSLIALACSSGTGALKLRVTGLTGMQPAFWFSRRQLKLILKGSLTS